MVSVGELLIREMIQVGRCVVKPFSALITVHVFFSYTERFGIAVKRRGFSKTFTKFRTSGLSSQSGFSPIIGCKGEKSHFPKLDLNPSSIRSQMGD